ncbi:MAG: DUF1559 domain-containing protein [Pirellulales bacterium]
MRFGTGREGKDRGFTLVELLVVIAIIGILVALLLPAVQAAREAARRANCQNNMRNLALALHSHHTAHQRFPIGFISQPEEEEAWGWTTFTLPYLEEQGLYDKLDPAKRRLADLFIAAKSDPSQLDLVQTPLPIFLCPSDDTPALLNTDNSPSSTSPGGSGGGKRHFNGNNTPPGFRPSTSNYMGLKGFINNNCPKLASAPASMGWVPDQVRCDNNGIFFGNSKVSIKQISDGTSHTFMLGERDGWCLAGTWIGSRNPPGPDMWGSHMLLGRVTLKLNHPLTDAHNTCTEGFSSRHPGGAYFAFCDTSVRFISDDINYDLANNTDACYAKSGHPLRCRTEIGGKQIGIYQRLGWRDDGMLVDGY